MDVVTHGMMGVIVASPLVPTHPIAAACFMMGSVLPDLDATSRVFGKLPFLRAHQTYSHSIPIILVLGAIGGIGLRALGFREPLAPVALTLGMVSHSLLDVTNTYGITLLAPFSRRRFCTEWVFFIDAVVVAATIPTLLYVGWQLQASGRPGWVLPGVYASLLAAYWLVKIVLRGRAGRLAPEGTLALLPSALCPWHFLGCAREGSEVRLFRIDARNGNRAKEERCAILDEAWLEKIRDVPEFRVMRELSPAYHVVEATKTPDGVKLACRDLRTRNFRTRFGELDLVLDPEGTVREKVFHA
jgi:membrane-bound metal-dependent hydrolase YbcI (DUF457 family)